MLRGNHESADINQMYGFQMELDRRFPERGEGLKLWNAFNDTFACMPLAAIIHYRILCMHGGIGPELKSLDDIRKMIMNGYGFFCKRRLVSVFSAPRYLQNKNNKCAIMQVEKDLRVGFILLCPVTPETQGKHFFF
ncbi:unnamed protein product, partial [Gongylonema pulchrum]|uniref:Serine/threonine-protein phosphatase n=1 Tax=Gongylonema pulchrum TaxID=637853 RepID=A0A183DCT3_9BILA